MIINYRMLTYSESKEPHLKTERFIVQFRSMLVGTISRRTFHWHFQPSETVGVARTKIVNIANGSSIDGPSLSVITRETLEMLKYEIEMMMSLAIINMFVGDRKR